MQGGAAPTEMKTLRAISGYASWGRQKNAHIREKYGVSDVVRGRKRAWNGYVSRVMNTRPAKIARNGRPPKAWKDS